MPLMHPAIPGPHSGMKLVFILVLLRACNAEINTKPAQINASTIINSTDVNATSSHSVDDGFLSQLSNFIFGSSKREQARDNQQAEDRISFNYAAPGPQISGHSSFTTPDECNPCNKEPWIPMAVSYGHFAHAPQEVNQHHAAVVNQQSYPAYGGSVNLGVSQDLHVPNSQHGSLYTQEYGQPNEQYGTQQQQGLPHIQFGPLPAAVVPPPPQYVAPIEYGALPALAPNLMPTYGAPPAVVYGAPSSLTPAVSIPPSPAAIFAAPSNFGTHYGPPKPIFKMPQKSYGPPMLNLPNFGLSKPVYPLGKAPRQIRPFGRPHTQFGFGPPPPQPVYKYIPIHTKIKLTDLPVNFKPPPPPPPSINYKPVGVEMFSSSQLDMNPMITNSEYLPPKQQLPISTNSALPFPTLSGVPVAPLHEAQNFHDNFAQSASRVEIPLKSNVQIQQSIPVTDFVASIEHPINIIRSPIVDVHVANTSTVSDGYFTPMAVIPQVHPTIPPPVLHPAPPLLHQTSEFNQFIDDERFKLSENPIVVEEEPQVAAATIHTNTTRPDFPSSSDITNDFLNQILQDFSDFDKPVVSHVPSTSMQPPPKGESFWLDSTTTKKPKQIQIIIPYTTNNNKYERIESPPVDYIKVSASNDVITQKNLPSSAFNRSTPSPVHPYDVIRLQKNIDGWTEQAYSHKIPMHTKAITKATSKRIPDEYLTTLPFNSKDPIATTQIPVVSDQYIDHEAAGSNSKEYLETNLIITTEEPTTTFVQSELEDKVANWEKIHIAVSPLTKEKVYVVTPQPSTRQSRDHEHAANATSSTFSISILPMRNRTKHSKDVRVVLSEWPHLINNLATTNKAQSSTQRTSLSDSLFDLRQLATYAPPANATVETYSGHSKVINAVTASLKKSSALSEEKKVSPTPPSKAFAERT